MSKVYCGAKKVPKGRKVGTESQCKSQIRLFGQQKVSNPIYNSLLTTGLQPVYCGARKTKRIHGTKAQCTQKRQIRKYGLFTLNSFVKSQTRPNTPKTQSGPKSISRKTNKRKAVNKILGFQKMKKEQEKFKQLMKNVNGAQQRRRTKLKAILRRDDQFTSHVLLTPSDIVKEIIPLSIDQTGSGSSVGAIYTYDYGVMVCKLTPFNFRGNKPNPGLHEVKLYSLLNNMVNHNVTPFVIKGLMGTAFSPEHTKTHKIDEDMVNLFELNKNFKGIAFLSESVDSKNISTFGNLMRNNQVFDNHIFQVLWTLECFNRIQFRHNDLHLGNILMFKHNRPKGSYRIFKYSDANGIKRKLFIPTTEYEARIFDFDRSQKSFVPNIRNLKPKYQQEIIIGYPRDKFMRMHTLFNENPQFDTFKFMNHLLTHHSYKVPGRMNSKLNIREMDTLKNQYKLEFTSFIRYLLPISFTKNSDVQFPDYPSTLELIEHIANKNKWYDKPKSGKLVEIYDMDNILK